MNRAYFLVPAALLLGFGVYHHLDHDGRQKAEATRTAQLTAAKVAEDNRRLMLKRQADEQMRQATEQRLAHERERREAKRRDFETAMAKLAAENQAATNECEKLAREVSVAEQQLADLGRRRETEERAIFDLAKQVELGRISRRKADLESQRALQMVTARLDAVTSPARPDAIRPRTP